MHQFLYEFLANNLCTDMVFEIKGYLIRGDPMKKLITQYEPNEDDVLRRKNRWRKYSL